MKSRLVFASNVLIHAAIGLQPVLGQTPLSADINYQGQLKLSGAPINATADFQFKLFGAVSGEPQIGSTQSVNNVNVVNGLFTAQLNDANQFGATAFNGDKRWLEIAVRSPAGSGTFTTLAPRQPVTATPYALKTRGVDGHSLDAADGSPADALFVDNTGNVGIGTTTPGTSLHVVAPMGGATPGQGVRIQGTASGVANQSYLSFENSAGAQTGYVGDGGGTENSIQVYSALADVQLYTAAGPVLTAKNGGSVGIGTTTPAAKLDVHGDIRLGNSGQFFAPAGEENLRIIRGTVAFNGSILAGSGFSVSHLAVGRYHISFNTSFSGMPSVTAAGQFNGPCCAGVASPWFVSSNGVEIKLHAVGPIDGPNNDTFHFIAVGPR